MNAVAYHLEARSPFHFGMRGVGVEVTEEVAHADTLFGALCLGLRELEGPRQLEEFLAAFPSDDHPDRHPPLLLSSAFPYARLEGDSIVRLYPRPRLPLPGTVSVERDRQNQKQLRRIQFVSEARFHAWVQGEPVGQPDDESLLHGETVWVTAEEKEQLVAQAGGDDNTRLWVIERAPRVTLDRATNASQLFHAGRVYFQPRGGLWCAIRWLDEEWQPVVERVLEVLGEVGIGGERSAGHGQFTWKKSLLLDLPDDVGSLRVTLALYHPTRSEVAAGVLDGEAPSYQLLMRRGRIGSLESAGARHRAVRMLAEGSVFRAEEGETHGGLVNVTPQGFTAHPVYRYGLAFPVGVRGHE